MRLERLTLLRMMDNWEAWLVCLLESEGALKERVRRRMLFWVEKFISGCVWELKEKGGYDVGGVAGNLTMHSPVHYSTAQYSTHCRAETRFAGASSGRALSLNFSHGRVAWRPWHFRQASTYPANHCSALAATETTTAGLKSQCCPQLDTFE